MSDVGACRGHAVVMQPGEGPSFWQPKPANGYSSPKLFPELTKFAGFSMGYQAVEDGPFDPEIDRCNAVGVLRPRLEALIEPDTRGSRA